MANSDDKPTVASPLRDRDVERLRASVREDPEDELLGGAFELVREAGAGGMGKVYEAIERATSRRVAIKVITGLAGPSERARFAAEIEVIERLDHPAIVDYVAHGETARGEPYLAMEWLVGESLSHRLDRAKLSIPETAILGERIADALDHAHRAGVVHRDLKPSNIFLVDGKASEAHLIDFGVAKQADRDLTHTGQLIGTPGYMAPEQVRGEKTVNASADLFALGCVLYRALSGRDAFEGAEVMEILARLLLEDPEPIESLVVDLPPRFAHLIGSLLSKDPKRRLGDAAITCTELRAIRRALEDKDAPALALRPDAVPTPAPVADVTVRDEPRRGWLPPGRAWWAIAGVAMIAIVFWWQYCEGRRDAGVACSEATPDGCAQRCEDNDAAACYLYARSLHEGRVDTVDHEKGRVIDGKACRLGDARGCVAASKSLFAVATKHTPDPTHARALLAEGQQLLELGCDSHKDPESCRVLGRALSKGQGPLPPDPPRAFALVIRACEADHVPACNALPAMVGDTFNGATEDLRDSARTAFAAACLRKLPELQCPR